MEVKGFSLACDVMKWDFLVVKRGYNYLRTGLGRCDMDMTKLQKLKECFLGKNDGTYINEVESLLFDKLQSAVGGCNTLNSGSLNQFHC